MLCLFTVEALAGIQHYTLHRMIGRVNPHPRLPRLHNLRLQKLHPLNLHLHSPPLSPRLCNPHPPSPCLRNLNRHHYHLRNPHRRKTSLRRPLHPHSLRILQIPKMSLMKDRRSFHRSLRPRNPRLHRARPHKSPIMHPLNQQTHTSKTTLRSSDGSRFPYPM